MRQIVVVGAGIGGQLLLSGAQRVFEKRARILETTTNVGRVTASVVGALSCAATDSATVTLRRADCILSGGTASKKDKQFKWPITNGGTLRATVSDLTLNLDDLVGRVARELAERVRAAASVAERFRIVHDWLRARLAVACPLQPAVAWSAAQLERHAGGLSIAALRAETGLSKPRLVAAFREQLKRLDAVRLNTPGDGRAAVDEHFRQRAVHIKPQILRGPAE